MMNRTIRQAVIPALAALVLAAPALAQPAPAGMVRREVAYPTGNRGTSVILLERVAPATVRMGQAYEYTLTLTNLTNTEIKDVVLTEKIAATLDVAQIAPQPTSQSGNEATWSWPALGPRQTQTIRIAGTPTQMDDIICCATVTFKALACATTKVVQPALQLVKETPADVVICDPIPVRLVVTNTGTGTARNVVINDPLPDGWTTSDGKREVNIHVGDLAAGQSREYTVATRASQTGSFVNRATAREAGGLTAEASSSTNVHKPELQLTKTGPRFRFIGRPATFEITVTNTGDIPARQTVLVDQVPAGTAFVSASDGGQFDKNQVRWALGDLPPGASKTVKMTVKVQQRGSVRNVAVARAYCADGEASFVMEARGIPAILLEVVDLEDPVEVGGTTTYLITVVNQGSAEGTNIKITCELPPEESLVSAQGPTPGTASGRTITFAPLPSLAPKAKATYRIAVKGEGTGDVRFGVTLKSDQMTSPVQETESTHIY